MKRFFIDEYGPRPFGIVLGILLGVAVLVGGVCAISYRIDTRACALQAKGLSLPGRFDLWSSTCFVTLPDGRSVDIDILRFNEQGSLVEKGQ